MSRPQATETALSSAREEHFDEIDALLARSHEMTSEITKSTVRWTFFIGGVSAVLFIYFISVYRLAAWWPLLPILFSAMVALGPLFVFRRYWKESMGIIEGLITRATPGDRRVATTVVGALSYRQFRPHARRRLKEVLMNAPPESWDHLDSDNRMHVGDFYVDLLLWELTRAMKRKFEGADDLDLGRTIVRTLGDIASPNALDCLMTLARSRPRSAALQELKAVAVETVPKAQARIEARKQTEHLLHPAGAPVQDTLLRPTRSSPESDREALLRVPLGENESATATDLVAENAQTPQHLSGA